MCQAVGAEIEDSDREFTPRISNFGDTHISLDRCHPWVPLEVNRHVLIGRQFRAVGALVLIGPGYWSRPSPALWVPYLGSPNCSALTKSLPSHWVVSLAIYGAKHVTPLHYQSTPSESTVAAISS